MNDDVYKRWMKIQEDVSDDLLAMNTYLKRHELLIDKVCQYLPATLLEEYAEFLVDWGRSLEKFGEDGKEHSKVMMKIFEEIE